jgi:hypothetical protein
MAGVGQEQAGIECFPPGGVWLKRFDQAGIGDCVGDIADVGFSFSEVSPRDGESVAHGELVEVLLVQEELMTSFGGSA